MMRKARQLFGIPCLGTSMGFAPEGELEVSRCRAAIVHSIARNDGIYSCHDETENTGRIRSNIAIQRCL